MLNGFGKKLNCSPLFGSMKYNNIEYEIPLRIPKMQTENIHYATIRGTKEKGKFLQIIYILLEHITSKTCLLKVITMKLNKP